MNGVRPVAWFAGKDSLRSGWAWGQHYLEDGVAAAEAKVGKGKVFLFGPEITFRAQPHGTFKFLFNGIYYGTVDAGRRRRRHSTTTAVGTTGAELAAVQLLAMDLEQIFSMATLHRHDRVADPRSSFPATRSRRSSAASSCR